MNGATYSKQDVMDILARHRDAAKGQQLIGLGVAALSGAFVVGLIWWLSNIN